ncbi:MAG TPA: hypothetical protein VK797_04675 [Tepidisphaeraceae bacterium]|nr:hypothetical protein [Tepidisphaeraceae bacterium]
MSFIRLAMVTSGIVALCAGCTSWNVEVGAKNGALSAYQSKEGAVNTPAFALGDVVAMDTETHKAWKIGSIEVAPTDIAIGQTADQATEPFQSGFDLAFSQKVSNTMQDSVDEIVRGQTELHVENYFARSIKKPESFVVGNWQLAKAVLKASAQNPQAKFFLVSGVTSADKVYLTFNGGPDSTAKVGQYTFRVSYPQNEELAKLAEDTPAFFKTTPLKVQISETGHQTVAVDQNFDEKLPDYKFDNAVASVSE